MMDFIQFKNELLYSTRVASAAFSLPYSKLCNHIIKQLMTIKRVLGSVKS